MHTELVDGGLRFLARALAMPPPSRCILCLQLDLSQDKPCLVNCSFQLAVNHGAATVGFKAYALGFGVADLRLTGPPHGVPATCRRT